MELIVEVPGMTCGHCEAAVKSEVGKLAGVGDVRVDLQSKLVTVTGEHVDAAAVTAAIDEAGFEVSGAARGPVMHHPAAVRLAAFVLVIAGSFGTAYGLGRKLPGNPESKPHTHGQPAASPVPPGFAVDGYVLVTDANQPSTSALALHINGPDGRRVTTYTEALGTKLHVVLVRFDLSGFRDLHPDIDADGSFVVPIDQPGRWHIVVESEPAGAAAPIALATNVDDELPVHTVALPAPRDKVASGDLIVARDGLTFTVTSKDGSVPSGLDPYLGQAAHLIAIRQGDLAYHHLHVPDAPAATFMFHDALPKGTYRLFLQFGARGAVETVAFTMVQP